MGDVDVHVSSHLKEELTWAIDKRLQVISTIMLFKTSYILLSKNQALQIFYLV